MHMIAPVFHPRARTSPEVEAMTADAMKRLAWAEGHRPGEIALASRFKPLTDVEAGYVRLAQQKLRRGGNVHAIAREMGIYPKRLAGLLTRGGVARDGSEVSR